jgi:hypothetical protein
MRDIPLPAVLGFGGMGNVASSIGGWVVVVAKRRMKMSWESSSRK